MVLRNVGIMFRNFSGAARRYNNEGDRNFNASVSAEQAAMLKDIGFYIKELPPRDEFDEPLHLLKVKVSYRYSAPSVKLITTRCTRELTEDTIAEMDHVSLVHTDISVMPSAWSQPNGTSGVTAYLYSMRATMLEDPLDDISEDDEEAPF